MWQQAGWITHMQSISPRPRIADGAKLDEGGHHIVDVRFHPQRGKPFWIERQRSFWSRPKNHQ